MAALYKQKKKYFPNDKPTYVVSALYGKQVALPSLQTIFVQKLRRMGLEPENLYYDVVVPPLPENGKGTVFIDGRKGGFPVLYVEDKQIGRGHFGETRQPTSRHEPSQQLLTHVREAAQPTSQREQIPQAPPTKVQTQRARFQNELGWRLSLNGRDLFIPDNEWQSASREGQKALYNHKESIYTLIESEE